MVALRAAAAEPPSVGPIYEREGVTTTYTVESKLQYWLFVYLVPFLTVGTGVGFIWITASGPDRDSAATWGLASVWFCAVLWGCYRQATMPHTIEVTDTGTIRFVGTFCTSALAPSDVISVRVRSGPFVEVRHVGGKIFLLQQFTGFHEFLTELKRANPNVAMRGV